MKEPKGEVSDGTYAALGLLVAVAGVVFGAVGLPLEETCIGLLVLSLLVIAWRRWERGRWIDPVMGVASAVLAGSVAVLAIGALNHEGTKLQSAPDPRNEASEPKVIKVYNRVTSGPKKMREDAKDPVFLLTRALAFCDERRCAIPGTRRESGDIYDGAVCRRLGERVTNGQDNSRIDDHNPGLFSSRRYYGVRLENGAFGYVSYVWIAPEDRGGLGLPPC